MTIANGILDSIALDDIRSTISVPIPSAITLADMGLPSDFQMILQDFGPSSPSKGSVNYTAEQLFDLRSSARSNPQNIYGVNSITGVDTNSGTEANPYQSLGKAISAGKAAGLPFKVSMIGGGTPSQDAIKNKNFTNGSASSIYDSDVDFCVEYRNGFSVVGSHVDFSAPSLNSGASYTYIIPETSLDNILDRGSLDRDGFLKSFTRVPFTATGDIPSGTWAWDGTNVLVRRSDSAQVTNANVRLIQSVPNFRNTYNISIGFFPVTPGDVLILEGGGTYNAPFDVTVANSRTDLTQRVIALKNVRSAGYAHASAGAGRSFSIDGLSGLAVLENCMGAYAKTDQVNVHNTRGLNGVSGVKMRLLTINMKGRVGGKERRYGGTAGSAGVVSSNDSSCNGPTYHEDVMGYDLAGNYQETAGGCIRNINTSKMLAAGTMVHDLGDRWLGSTTQPTGVRTQDTSEFYGFRVKMPDMPPGSVAYNNTGGVIALRECYPTSAVNIGAITTW